jgi:hypothetical protein
MPSYQKQPIETILDNQEVQTSMTKVTKFVSGLVNGVEVKADNCPNQSYAQFRGFHWWGTRWYLDNCAVNQLKRYGNYANVAAASGNICGWRCATVLVGVLQVFMGDIDWDNNHCGSSGVEIDMNYIGLWIYNIKSYVRKIC